MRLSTKRLVLRDNIEMKDAKDLIRAVNNIDVSRWLARVPYPFGMKEAKRWISKYKENAKAKPRTEYAFFIELAGKPGIIGSVGLKEINKFQGTASIGYWLNQDYWRQGIMSEAVGGVIDFAFVTLKLRRIDICAFVGNEPSNGLIRKLGFAYEGTRKERCKSKSNGKIHDEHIYGLLKKNWKN